MIFVVKYSKEKDIWNHLNTNWKFSYRKHGREDILERIRKSYPDEFINNLQKAKSEKRARVVINNFLDTLPKSFHDITPLIVRGVEQLLNEKKSEIVGKLEKVFEEKFPFSNITVYLSTCLFYPYSYKQRWYLLGRNSSEENHIKITLHELNHFMFYYYYPHLKKDLGKEKYEVLKEALAIYTNPEGNDKPGVQRLESYFKENASKSLKKLLAKKDWRKLL